MVNATRIEDLTLLVKTVWEEIDPINLGGLVASMPKKIKSVMDNQRDYINA